MQRAVGPASVYRSIEFPATEANLNAVGIEPILLQPRYNFGNDAMFTWLNKQGVRSDEGFDVQRTGRFDAEYIESGKVVTLDVQSGVSGGLPCISIDPKAFKRWSDGTPIPDAEQGRLLRNFRAAMEFQGLKVVVEEAAE
jgi:hypothetical protein